MAKVEEHLRQWQRNRGFLQTITGDYFDWQVTVAFYVALHAVDALLTADGARDRSSHQHRNEILQREQRYQKIFKHFRTLYDLAHQTRYAADSSRWIPAQDVQKRVVEERLYPIETSVRKLLAERKPAIEMAPHEPLHLKGATSPPA